MPIREKQKVKWWENTRFAWCVIAVLGLGLVSLVVLRDAGYHTSARALDDLADPNVVGFRYDPSIEELKLIDGRINGDSLKIRESDLPSILLEIEMMGKKRYGDWRTWGEMVTEKGRTYLMIKGKRIVEEDGILECLLEEVESRGVIDPRELVDMPVP